MIKTGINHCSPPAIFMILAEKYDYKLVSVVSLWILHSHNKISICVIASIPKFILKLSTTEQPGTVIGDYKDLCQSALTKN